MADTSKIIYGFDNGTKYAFAPVGSIDVDRLVLGPPKENKITLKNGKNRIWYTSVGRYLDDNGEECVLYYELPVQKLNWGLTPKYPDGSKEANKEKLDPADLPMADECTVKYPLTTEDTVKKPTSDERYIRKVWDRQAKLLLDGLAVESKKPRKEQVIPPVTRNSYSAAKESGNLAEAIKPMFMDGWNSEKKAVDKAKPQKIELKCKKNKRGGKYNIETVFRGGQNATKNAKRLIGGDGAGDWRICVEWGGAYYGTHGSKEYGASVTNKVKEANIKPREKFSRGVNKQLLPFNEAPAEEDTEFDDPSGTAHEETNDGDFQEGSDSDDSDTSPVPSPKPSPKKAPKKGKTVPAKKAPVKKGKAVPAPKKGKAAPKKTITAAEKRRIEREKNQKDESESDYSDSDEE